jgi:hypothetical protein
MMGLCRDKAVTYLQKFGFNVVRLPSAGITPLQLIGEHRGAIGIIGALTDMVMAPSGPPAIELGAEAANISGQRTSKIPLTVSGQILDSIVLGMGAKAKASAAYDNAYALQFELQNVKRDRIRIVEVGRYLGAHEIAWDNFILSKFLFGPGKLYIIREVLKSNTLSVSAFDRDGKDAEVNLSVVRGAAMGTVRTSQSAATSNTVKYEGNSDLVFGFVADMLYSQDDPVTGMLALGFEPVQAGQIALSATATGSGRAPGPAFGGDVLDRLEPMSLEELGL